MNSISNKIEKKLRHYIRIPQTIARYKLDEKDNSQRYIFHHVPKCGGTSAVDALTNWFVILKDYPVGWCDEDNPPLYQKFCSNPHNLDKIKPYQLLVGHYHLADSFLDRRYPDWEKKGYKLFTFLRDPLELQISLYYYEIRMGRISADEPIADRLLLRPNYIANLMRCNNSNYLDVLRQYFFIGIMEKYQESFDRLSMLTGKPPVTLRKYNESPRSSFGISSKLISDFKEANQLDYKMYDYATSFYGQEKQSILPQGLFV